MRRLRWCGVATALVAITAHSACLAAEANTNTPLQTIIERFPTDRTCEKAGISYSTIKNGTVAWGAAGSVYPSDSSPARSIRKNSDIFKIGSVTKTFTATLYALALSQSKLAATDRAQNYLQNFTNHNLDLTLPVVTKNGASSPNLTVDQLAHHASGLPRGLRPSGQSLSPVEMSRQVNASNFKLEFVSGTYFLYSNLGFAVLARVMQKIYGPSIQDLLRTEVASPLGMNKTAIGAGNFNNSDLLRGVKANGDWAVVGNPTWPAFDGAGALRSTPADMETFLKFNMGLLPDLSLSPLLPTLQSMMTLDDYQNGGSTKVGLAWQQSPLTASDPIPIVWKDGKVAGFTAYIGFKASPAPGRTPSSFGVVVLVSQESCSAIKIGKCALEYIAGIAQRPDCPRVPNGGL